MNSEATTVVEEKVEPSKERRSIDEMETLIKELNIPIKIGSRGSNESLRETNKNSGVQASSIESDEFQEKS